MNKRNKNMKESTRVWQIIVILVFAIGFSIGAIIYGKSFTYKEVSATVISHEDVKIAESDYVPHCFAMAQYNVNGVDYETKLYLDYHYCYDGYKTTVYYDENNPQNAVKEKSTTVFIILLTLAIMLIFGSIYMIIDWKKKKKKD